MPWPSCLPGRAHSGLSRGFGGFLCRAEAVPREGQILPSAHVTQTRGQEDLGVEMPHSAGCCLCAFEIGVSGAEGGKEGGEEGGEGGTGLVPSSQFLSGIEGSCLGPLRLCCFRCSSVFLHVNFFLFYYPVPQPLPETPGRLGERFLQPQLGLIWAGTALPPLPGGGCSSGAWPGGSCCHQTLPRGDGDPMRPPRSLSEHFLVSPLCLGELWQPPRAPGTLRGPCPPRGCVLPAALHGQSGLGQS